MNCEQIIPLLSAFHDGELRIAQKAQVEAHVATCPDCAQRLQSHQRLSALVQKSSAPPAPKSLLERVESALAKPIPVVPRPTRSYGGAVAVAVLAAAAAFACFVVLQHFARTPANHHAEMTATYDGFLKSFAAGEADTPQILVSRYQGKAIDARYASEILKHESVARPTLLAKHEIANRFLLLMPNCNCVETVYSCNGKTSLVLFEHEQVHSEWFDKRGMMRTECAGKECCLVELDGHLAATWKMPGGYVTAVGVHDKAELEQLMRELESS